MSAASEIERLVRKYVKRAEPKEETDAVLLAEGPVQAMDSLKEGEFMEGDDGIITYVAPVAAALSEVGRYMSEVRGMPVPELGRSGHVQSVGPDARKAAADAIARVLGADRVKSSTPSRGGAAEQMPGGTNV